MISYDVEFNIEKKFREYNVEDIYIKKFENNLIKNFTFIRFK